MPLPAIDHVFSGFQFLGVILVTAIPYGIYDLVEAMDNVESAEAAGDTYPTTRVLTADGVVSLIGCLMGNPFINAVYIGHPGWKAMGGRIGYSAAIGVMVIVLSWFGVISLLLAIIPVVAISPILLVHRHADRRAGVPDHAGQARAGHRSGADAARRGLGQDVDGRRLGRGRHGLWPGPRAGLHRQDGQNGVLYQGLDIMCGGSILTGLVLAAIGVFVIDREFMKASAFALAGAVLTYFGFMHGDAVGIGHGFGVTPSVCLGYLIVAGFLFALSKQPAMVDVPATAVPAE